MRHGIGNHANNVTLIGNMSDVCFINCYIAFISKNAYNLIRNILLLSAVAETVLSTAITK